MWVFQIIIISVAFGRYVRSQDRIVGGNEVSIDDFPYQLSVRVNSKHICGGALIGSKYGLSAAHCFKTPGLYSVRAGSNLKEYGGTMAYVKTVFLHPERASHLLQYDIAILEFHVPFTFTSSIQPVKLPENDFLLSPGVNGIISGFGDTFSSANTGSKILRAVEISIQDNSWCQTKYQMYRINLSSMVFCAGSVQGGRDSCQGDSGGPFVIDNVLYGLVSFGLECGDPNYPGVYTNVALYREFIQLNTGI